MTKFPDLLPRVIAAVVGASLIVFGIIYGLWTYFAVILIISTLTLWEFYRLVAHESNDPFKWLGTIFGAVLVVVSFLVITNKATGIWLLLLVPLGFMIFTLKLYQKKDSVPFAGIANTWLGIIYIAVPFSIMHLVAYAPGYYDFQLVLGTLFLHWAHDVGAYFAGVKFGKRHLFERWSPSKSWEGSLGGAVLALSVAAIGAQWADSLSLWQWLILAAIIIIAGTFGDLVESQFKRGLDLKDSGHSIPGHGGFLDRFDGLLLSTPFVAAYLQLILSQ